MPEYVESGVKPYENRFPAIAFYDMRIEELVTSVRVNMKLSGADTDADDDWRHAVLL